MQAGTTSLSVQGLTHRYDGKIAVDNATFHVASGEIAALLGPSGCGKTTILRAIAGFLPVQPGVISLGDKDLSSLPGSARGIGMVFQNYALFPHMTVAENIAYPLTCHGWSRERRSARVDELLSVVHLNGLGRRLPRSLSGGQQQRVAVARALAVDPALLLLDEPFAALDRALRLELQMELIRLQRTLGITTIIVTHDQEEAQTLANRIIVMNNGVVEQVGSATDVYDAPASLFVNRFVGHASSIAAVVRSVEASGTILEVSTGETSRASTAARFHPRREDRPDCTPRGRGSVPGTGREQPQCDAHHEHPAWPQRRAQPHPVRRYGTQGSRAAHQIRRPGIWRSPGLCNAGHHQTSRLPGDRRHRNQSPNRRVAP